MIPNCYACILHYVVLLHIKHLMSAGAQLDIVYCIVPNVCALDTAGYIHCMLCSMYCHMHVSAMGIAASITCCLRNFLPQALHCYCMLHAVAMLHQIMCCIYAATWSKPMGTSTVHGILRKVWYIVYCYMIHYC